jgi:hypothetical protein
VRQIFLPCTGLFEQEFFLIAQMYEKYDDKNKHISLSDSMEN